MNYICFLLLLVCINEVTGYAKLGETVNCANEDCSETISEGKAKLVYRPKDEKFLQMKKGDVVLVQGKKAGDQTELWVGQVMGSERIGFFPRAFVKEFLIIHKKPSVVVKIQNLFKEANKQSSVFHQDQVNIVIEKSNSEVTKTEETNVAEEPVEKNPDISSNNVDAEKEKHKKEESIYKEKLEILGDQNVNADTDSTKLNKDDTEEIIKEQENDMNKDVSISYVTDENENLAVNFEERKAVPSNSNPGSLINDGNESNNSENLKTENEISELLAQEEHETNVGDGLTSVALDNDGEAVQDDFVPGVDVKSNFKEPEIVFNYEEEKTISNTTNPEKITNLVDKEINQKKKDSSKNELKSVNGDRLEEDIQKESLDKALEELSSKSEMNVEMESVKGNGHGNDEIEKEESEQEHQTHEDNGFVNAKTQHLQTKETIDGDYAKTSIDQTKDNTNSDVADTTEHQPEDSAGSDKSETPEHQLEDGTAGDNTETPEHQLEDGAGGDNAETPEDQPEDADGVDNSETPE
ncbi:uncharacterized protein LOC144742408, partial [Ciona intestinalis]